MGQIRDSGGAFIHVVEDYMTLPAEVKRDAALYVCDQAESVEEARELMDMLGVLDAPQ